MNNISEDTKWNYTVTICAVLHGCDESLVGLDLGRGFKIIKKSLIPIDNLDEVFEMDAVGLRREYEDAIIDADTLSVACIFKEYNYVEDAASAHSYFKEVGSKSLKYLDDKIRAIRLILEGPIRFKKLAIKIVSDKKLIVQTRVGTRFSSIMPIGEAYDVKTIKKVHCNDLEWLSSEMNKITFPLAIEYINLAHIFYERSYLVTLPEAEVLLITSLEILFLDSNSAIKEKLSKRCATFLYETQEDRVRVYKRLRSEYKKRCDIVHDGNIFDVSEESIIFLRKLVRESILKLLNIPRDKKKLMADLVEEIRKLDYWNSNKV